MINFPKISIATSVVNRILNAADDIETLGREASAPAVPDPAPLGDAIDKTIAEPAGPLSPTDPAMTDDLTTGVLFP